MIKLLALMLLVQNLFANWLFPTHLEKIRHGGVTEYGSTVFFSAVGITMVVSIMLILHSKYGKKFIAALLVIFILTAAYFINAKVEHNEWQSKYREYLRHNHISIAIRLSDAQKEQHFTNARNYANGKTELSNDVADILAMKPVRFTSAPIKKVAYTGSRMNYVVESDAPDLAAK